MPDTKIQPREAPEAPASSPAPVVDNAALNRLLDAWMRADEAEQRETFATLVRSLDEERPEAYKLFP
ncbi:MAG: hypothetical protein HY820_45800 [Acidobacteria bacterium]|nr:hypothetical protein [Acidobacteriota bacterium]